MENLPIISKFSLLSTLSLSLGLLIACQSATEESDINQQQVTILGVIIGEQQKKLEQALAPFTEQTGIEIVYEGTDTFARTLAIRVDSGKPPDLAMFPRPGLMADFAREGKLIPLKNFMSLEQLQSAYTDFWLELGSVDETLYGVWYRASVKSLVWYNPKVFEKNGYEIPKNWVEMLNLSDRLVLEGKTPWCLGMESGDSTGWVGTDWVEDIMLRTVGAENYDRWIRNEIPFTDDSVGNAFKAFGIIALNEEYVSGGKKGVLRTPVEDSIQGLFGENPHCYLHRQGNFIASVLPEAVNTAEDVAIFPFPSLNPDYGTPILVAGDVFAMFNDTPEARKLMEYLASEVPHKIAAGLGGYLSPRKNIPLALYPDKLTQQQAQILANAEVIRFDGSALMPGAVGTGTFQSGMVDFVAGKDLDKVLQRIENSWTE